jgi:hypothetical protein
MPRAGKRQRGGQAGDTRAGDEYVCLSVTGFWRCGHAADCAGFEQAALGTGFFRAELGIVDIERRAIGADLFVLVAHVEKDMRVVEGRIGALRT